MKYIILITVLFLSACIPVTIRPQFDEEGLPKATPVTIIGQQDLETGVFYPAFPTSQKPPTPPSEIPWDTILQIGLALAGVGGLGGAGAAMRVASRAKTAIKLVAELADANAVTMTEEGVERNKLLAAKAQEAAGVRDLIQAVRKK